MGEDAESFLPGLSQGLETGTAPQPSWALPQANLHGGQGVGGTEAAAPLTAQTSRILCSVGTLGGGSLAWSFAASHCERMLSSLNRARFPIPWAGEHQPISSDLWRGQVILLRSHTGAVAKLAELQQLLDPEDLELRANGTCTCCLS